MTRPLLVVARLLALLALAACAPDSSQSSLDPRTDFAQTIQGLYSIVFWWSVVILIVVWGALGYILVRFRERPGTPHPKQRHGHLGVEIAWTVGPAFIVVAILVPTIQALFETQRNDPEGAYVIDVIGHQFWWEFRYPEGGVVTANELHLPVGRAISLRLQSADVIHSFWVPQLGGKRDVNPIVTRPEGGAPRYNWLHFTIQEPGLYSGQCAEFCGLSHSLMGTRVVAETEADFQSWMAAWAGAPIPVDIGGGPAGTPPDSAGAAAAPAAGAPAAPPGAAPGAPAGAQGGTPAGAGQGQVGQLATPTAQLSAVERGRTTFMSSLCIACHAIQGTPAAGIVGPNLTLFGRRGTLAAGWLENNQENLERWIADPASVKPGVLMPGVAGGPGGLPPTNLSPEQVSDVAAYLLSLR